MAGRSAYTGLDPAIDREPPGQRTAAGATRTARRVYIALAVGLAAVPVVIAACALQCLLWYPGATAASPVDRAATTSFPPVLEETAELTALGGLFYANLPIARSHVL